MATKECRNPVVVRADLIDPDFMLGLGHVVGWGAQKYGDNNWKSGLTGCNSGLNHALVHIAEYQRGTVSEIDETVEGQLYQAAVNLMFEAYFARKARLAKAAK